MWNESIRAKVIRNDRKLTIDVMIYRIDADGIIYLYTPEGQPGGEINWVWKPFSAQDEAVASFEIPATLGTNVIEMLVDEIHTNLGIRAKGERIADDVLTAKDEHLSDLQRIIFGSDFIRMDRGLPMVVDEEEKGNATV